MQGVRESQARWKQVMDDRKQRVALMAEWFGLDEPYSYRVLSSLLLASEDFEEPPFKPLTDIGWLWRGYCLATGVADSIRAAAGHPNNPRYPAWPKDAAKVFDEYGDDWLLLTEKAYNSLQSLFQVPDGEHAELHAIVGGLSLFSEHRGSGRPHRYICLVLAIVAACETGETPHKGRSRPCHDNPPLKPSGMP